MVKAKVAVLVSGGGTNLQAIIDAAGAGQLPHAELAVVIASNPGAYALERAAKAGIPTAVASRKELGSQEAFENSICEALDRYEIDLIVLAGFLSILSESFVKKYPKRIINIHPSLIPSFCGEGFYGLRVHEAALNYGVKVSGATVHFVNEIPVGGEIIMQKAVYFREGDTPEVLQRRIMEEAEWKLLPAATEKISEEIVREKESK